MDTLVLGTLLFWTILAVFLLPFFVRLARQSRTQKDLLAETMAREIAREIQF